MMPLPPMVRLLARVAAASAVVAGLAGLRADAQGPSPRAPNPASTDGVLAAYLSGETDSVSRGFKTSLDLQNRLKLADPREFDKWLGAYEPGKAVFVLALARSATDIGPQYTAVLLRSGARYVDGRPQGDRGGAATTEFARAWHRAALALLQGLHHSPAIEEHLAAIEARSRADVMADPRLTLARAIAQEQRCWASRPADQPSVRVDVLGKAAGATLRRDLDGPTRAGRDALVTENYKCLTEAVARFDLARAAAETRAEAGVRGGWALVQQTQFQAGIAWLDAAAPGSDAALAYWRGIFRGRALAGLDRHHEAADAYRDAVKHFPGAQTAGLGLAFELLLLGQSEDADSAARALRATATSAIDPWTTYLDGDRRFADNAIEKLRKQVMSGDFK